MSGGRKYSDYYQQLEESVQIRYNAKLDSVGAGVDDPYTFSCEDADCTVPNIEYPDILLLYNYTNP